MNSRGTNSEGVRARCRRKGLTFQVLRRTSGTGMQKHGDLKATHGMLRHASIQTIGDGRAPRQNACYYRVLARTLEDQSYANGYADAASHRNNFNLIPKTTL